MEESKTKLLRKLRNPGELEKLVDRLYILSQIYKDEMDGGGLPTRCGEDFIDKVLLSEELADRLVQLEEAESALSEHDREFLRALNIRPWQ
jgi:hypothetical protein